MAQRSVRNRPMVDGVTPMKDERSIVPTKRKEEREASPLASKTRATKKQKGPESAGGDTSDPRPVTPDQQPMFSGQGGNDATSSSEPSASTSKVGMGKDHGQSQIGGNEEGDDDGDYLSVWAIARGLKEEDDFDGGADDGVDVSKSTSSLYPPSSIKLPTECEVFNEEEQAESLRDIYKTLPNLSVRAFMSWSEKKEDSKRMRYDEWYELCPFMNGRKSWSAMEFVAYHRLFHLARCDPRGFAARMIPVSGRSRVMTFNDSDIGIVSVVPIRVSECCLKTPGNLGKKYVRGFMHTQDEERFISVVCMVFGEDSMHCNMKGDEFTFETWGEGRKGNDSLPNSPYRGGRVAGSSPSKAVVSSTQSRAVLTGSSGITGGYIKTTLSASDEVRIFDGRNKKINWSSDLVKIHEILPQFEGEMMADSFAVVAHTTTAYAKKDKEGVVIGQAVSLNVQWAMLLGSPDQKRPRKKNVGTSK